MQTMKTNLVILATSLVLGLIFNYLFFESLPGLSVPVFCLVALAAIYGFGIFYNQTLPVSMILPGAILFFSFMVFWRSSPMLIFLNIVLILYLFALLVREAGGERFRTNFIQDYLLTLFAIPWRLAVRAMATLGELISLRGVLSQHRPATFVIKGIAMALPLVVVFLLLFSSADLAFRKFLSNIVTLNLTEETWAQLIIVAVVTWGFIGLFSYVLKHIPGPANFDLGLISPTKTHPTQITAFLGTISAIFMVFIAFQLRYFFGGGANISEQGFTYAEYAHRGFIELIIVAVLSLLLILVAERFVDQNDKGHARPFQIVASIIIVEVMIIMSSALIRLVIYQDAYGFTTLRLYTTAFIIWLAALFFVFGYKIIKNRSDQFFAYSIFWAVLVFVGLMNLLNPDYLIARQNLRHVNYSGQLDTHYLNSLSDDAVPGLFETTNEQIIADLRERKHRLQTVDTEWQETNWSRVRALRMLEEKLP
jgi:hypothetical protein